MTTQRKKLQRRAFERFPANFMVHFYYGDSINFGTVTDISENGMFVKTKIPIADVNSEFEVVIPSPHSELKVPVLVRRIAKNNDLYEGFGVEVRNRPEEYAAYVQNIKNPDAI